MRKVGTTQTKDQIADILREYILSGRLTSNADIVQEDLAEMLQLSRTPVREALQVLEQEGLLERLSNRHMRVVPVTQEEIYTIFQVLGALEGEILTLLSGHPEKWGELTRLAKEHAQALNQGYPGKCRDLEKTSQMVGTQAVMNVLSGERYKMVPKEIKDYVKGLYGTPPGEISPEMKEKIIGDEEVLTMRPADLLKPEMENFKAELGDLAESTEDVLMYALFPTLALPFLKKRKDPFYDIQEQTVTVIL